MRLCACVCVCVFVRVCVCVCTAQRAGVQMYRSAFNRGAPEGKALKLNLGPFGEIKLYNPFDILSVSHTHRGTHTHTQREG